MNIVKYFQLLQFDVTFEGLLEYFYTLDFCEKSDLIKGNIIYFTEEIGMIVSLF